MNMNLSQRPHGVHAKTADTISVLAARYERARELLDTIERCDYLLGKIEDLPIEQWHVGNFVDSDFNCSLRALMRTPLIKSYVFNQVQATRNAAAEELNIKYGKDKL